jgi:hypothetical protein
MSTPTKLRGGSASEVTKLKHAWRQFSELTRDYWRSRFCSQDTQAVLRAELLKKLKVNLTRDNQLTEFRSWDDANQQRELMAEKIEQRKQELLAGGMTLDEAQQVLLTEASAYSVASRDFKLGVKVSAEITRSTAGKLDREKFEFDAAKAALAHATELKTISTSKLSEGEKVNRARQRLFGVLPK